MSKVLGYPKGFKEYQQLFGDGHSIRDIGFRVGPGDINRFAHRVRVARAYEGGDLKGYGERTKLGYESLQRVVLTHSALERFLPVMFGKKEWSLNAFLPMLKSYDQAEVMHVLHLYDPEQAFWSSFRNRCRDRLQNDLDKCASGEKLNVLHISAGIRHIFAHGHLTPSANNVKPKDVRVICDTLSAFVIDFMDEEFYRKVKAYCDERELDYFDEQV